MNAMTGAAAGRTSDLLAAPCLFDNMFYCEKNGNADSAKQDDFNRFHQKSFLCQNQGSDLKDNKRNDPCNTGLIEYGK